MMHTRAERKMLPSRQPARGAAARPASLELRGMSPAGLYDAHACGEEEAARGQPARSAAARAASLNYSKNLREKEKAGLWQTIIWI